MGGRGSSSSSSKSTKAEKKERLIMIKLFSNERSNVVSKEVSAVRFNKKGNLDLNATVKNVRKELKNEPIEYNIAMTNKGDVLKAVSGGKNSVGMAKPKYKNDDISSIHNHPSKFGGVFSDGDMKTFSDFAKNHKNMIVVAKEGTYRITRRTSNADIKGLSNAYKNQYGMSSKTYRQAVVNFRKAQAKDYTPAETRRAVLKPYQSWLRRNASKYGAEFEFKADKKYKIK